MPLARRFLEVTQDTNVRNIGQPLVGHLVEMFQRVEGPAIEQAGFDIKKLAFAFSFCLWAANAAGLRAEAVVRGKGEELRVVNWAIGIVPQDHRLEVVV